MPISIGELFVELGFDVDDGKLKAFNSAIATARNELLEITAIATGSVYALNAFLEGSMQRAFGLKNFTTETGQAAEGLLRFQSAVNQVNASISTAQAGQAYRALANAMTDISQAGGGGALARLTGGAFRLGMKEEDVVEAIRNYKQRFIQENGGGQLGVAAHARLLEQIGLGAGSERVFDLSRDRYIAMTEDFVRAELKARDSTTELGDKVAMLKQRWDAFKDGLVGDWAMPLISGMDKAEYYTKDFVASVKAIIEAWEQWPPVIKEVSEVLLATLAIWAIPFGGTLALVTAIGAAIWDIGRAIRGLPSVTGTVLDSYKRNVAQPLADWLVPTDARAATKQVWTYDPKTGLEHLRAADGAVVTQNITAHITTNGEPKETMTEFQRLIQRLHNDALVSYAGSPVR